MAQSAVLNRLVLEGSEVAVEISVFEIDDSLTDEIVAKESIIVPELHL